MSSLWKRAAASIKDRNSLLLASLSGRTSHRNPDLEAAVIKATSHNEHHIDYRNAQRVFSWIRTSSVSLRSLMWVLSKRLEKTRSWVVAVKGLMLMHGIFCCKDVPSVQMIGRLPFDLSRFTDGHCRPSKTWGFNAFIRTYFAFLDQRSSFFYSSQERKEREQPISILQELVKLQKLQSLLDILLEIKPRAHNMKVSLILEAMDCVVIEIYDIYSRICGGIARVLWRIHSAAKLEAVMALHVLQKATKQVDELRMYFEFCKDLGVLNANDCPPITPIPEEDIRELERLIHGVPILKRNNDKENTRDAMDKEIVARENRGRFDQADPLNKNSKSIPTANIAGKKEQELALKTIVTDDWVIFEEDKKVVDAEVGFSGQPEVTALVGLSPAASVNMVAPTNHGYNMDLMKFE
ncbi:hypothetical protein SLA2020_026760 [Shorea laevis]